MAIVVEGFTVVAQLNRIRHLIDEGLIQAPNGTALNDETLWKCSFMAEADALKFLREFEELGLNVKQGPDSDAVLINEFNRAVDPYCEWLKSGDWEKAVIAWMDGTEPKTVVAREGWNPKVGSGLTFRDPSSIRHLEFLRLDDNVEVFLDKKTGTEVYIGRTSTPLDSLFKQASQIIRKHFVAAGEPSLKNDAAREVAEAVSMLEKVLEENDDWWNALWFFGKGQLALGNFEAAYKALKRAYQLERTVEAIPRELAGVCLELGKFGESASIAEAAATLEPDNPELLGNLSLSYIMEGRFEHAKKSIDAALKIQPDDQINQTLQRILLEIFEGRREAPKSLRDLSKKAKPKKRRFLGISW